VHRQVHGFGVVRHGDWRPSFETRFHHASFVIGTALGGVFVGEMHLDVGDLIGEPRQGAGDHIGDAGAQRFVVLDRVDRIDQDLHNASLLR
jgi:hypothetical protein